MQKSCDYSPLTPCVLCSLGGHLLVAHVPPWGLRGAAHDAYRVVNRLAREVQPSNVRVDLLAPAHLLPLSSVWQDSSSSDVRGQLRLQLDEPGLLTEDCSFHHSLCAQRAIHDGLGVLQAISCFVHVSKSRGRDGHVGRLALLPWLEPELQRSGL